MSKPLVSSESCNPISRPGPPPIQPAATSGAFSFGVLNVETRNYRLETDTRALRIAVDFQVIDPDFVAFAEARIAESVDEHPPHLSR